MSEKVLEWVSTMEELLMVVNQHFTHSAYMGMIKSQQHQWTFFQFVIPDITHLFSPVESAIGEHFVPVIYVVKVCGSVRTLSSLPVRYTGIAITKHVTTSQPNNEASTLVCSQLIQAIKGKVRIFRDES